MSIAIPIPINILIGIINVSSFVSLNFLHSHCRSINTTIEVIRTETERTPAPILFLSGIACPLILSVGALPATETPINAATRPIKVAAEIISPNLPSPPAVETI